MNDDELDRKLRALLREPEPEADQAFIDRVVMVARLDRDIREARRRALKRTLIECAAAIAVAATFYLLSQIEAPDPDGIIPLHGPAMAGLVMLVLWSVVTFPSASGPTRAA